MKIRDQQVKELQVIMKKVGDEKDQMYRKCKQIF